MRKLSLLVAGAAILASTACYHAVIDTGRPASGQVIEQPWAMSFAFGLVPPPVVETAAKCPNGIAKVETQWSFLNGLVNIVTFGIVTPMDIRVSCALRSSASADRSIPAAAFGSTTEAIEAASNQAAKTGREVYVQF